MIVSVFGLGAIAQKFHIPALCYLEEVSGIYLYDFSSKISSTELNMLTSECPKIKDIIPLESRDKYAFDSNIAIVCSPTHTHFNQVNELLENNYHILCEKPLVLKAEDAAILFDSAKKKKLLLQVGYHQRFRKETFLLKQKLSKAKKPIESVRISKILENNIPRHADWYTDMLLSGGVIYDLASHYIDLVNELVGLDYEKMILNGVTNICSNWSNDYQIGIKAECIGDFSLDISVSYEGKLSNFIEFVFADGERFFWPNIKNSGSISEIQSSFDDYASVKQISSFIANSHKICFDDSIKSELGLIRFCEYLMKEAHNERGNNCKTV